MTSKSKKRAKLYHVPGNLHNEASRVRHSTFVNNAAGKVSVRNSFVMVSNPQNALPAENIHDNDYELQVDPTLVPLDDSDQSRGPSKQHRTRVSICHFDFHTTVAALKLHLLG